MRTLVDELLDRVTGSKCFTSIDLRNNFCQILIAEEDRHKQDGLHDIAGPV